MGERHMSKEQFFALDSGKPRYEEIDVPGFGLVYIKKLNAGEKDAFERASSGAGSRALTVAHCSFDERGERLFSDDDVLRLNQFDPDILDPIATVALRLNGYTKEEQDKLLKNLNGRAVTS
jgi:hypothetical protein